MAPNSEAIRIMRAARLMQAFLDNTAVVVEQGHAEGAKPIATIFEQWAFFQISAALQAAGLRCISHSSIFEQIAWDRFLVDLKRNAPIRFEATDGRIVRLRYEPAIFRSRPAQVIDSIYQKESESARTPDIVLEIFVPGRDPSDRRLAYAAVIDAKYTTQEKIEDRLKEIEKYLKIRSVDTGAQIVRQLWAAASIETSLELDDKAVTWSPDGEVSADHGDVILGAVGANPDPADRDGTGQMPKAFVLGILNHAEAYARSNRSTVARNA